MKKLITIIIICFLTNQIFSQETGKISGKVLDLKTKKPIVGANVIIKDTKLGATTDQDGIYFILNIIPGVYEVSASIMGYTTVIQQNVIVNVNRTTNLDFLLEETVIDIGREITILAERPDVQKDKTSSSEIIRTEEIQAAPGVRDMTDIIALSPDVIDGHFRGGREGEELYTLSGMGIVNPLTSLTAFVPIASAIEEVEIITSGFSAQYGNAQSGVVNITMKEGSPSKWKGRLEIRSRLPGYKHWGGSIFNLENNPYLQILDSWEKWLGTDTSRGGIKYFQTLGYGFTTLYKDSIQAAQIAYALWKQARKDLNKQYNNLWDKSIDFNINGPLTSDATMFLAMRYENIWPIIPPTDPDIKKQMMGNVVYNLKDGMTIRFSGAYSNVLSNDFRSLNSSYYQDFRYWIWDRTIGVGKELEDNLQLGIRFAHTVSPSTFYELKISKLITKHYGGVNVLNPERYRDDISDLGLWRYFETPDYFRIGHMDNQFINEKTSTLSIDGSITSQITNSHMLLGGVQLNFYDVNVKNKLGLSSPPQAIDEIYSAFPYELGLYIQDKMEFEGMIANFGLRFDAYNQNVKYYVDQFYPVFGSEMKHTPTITSVQPRIGIAFPVSLSTVFHLNYGSFLQRPSFERTILSRINRGSGAAVRLGNPRLKPQDTKSYDVGITQGLGEGFTIDISGYYKDVSNLVERAFFFNSRGTGMEFYETFINRDYADIRGFRISINKRSGTVNGSIKYNYSVATGKSSTPFNASPTFREDPATVRKDDKPDPKDVLLDFDRTHNLVLQLGLQLHEEYGIKTMGFYPLGNINISIKSSLRSGRPYTSPDNNLGLRFNARAPMEYNTDLKITKKLPKISGVNPSFYIEIFNLFNNKTYSYNTVFSNVYNARKFEQNRESLRWFDLEPSFIADQTFLIYSNAPRSVNIGLIINM